MTTCNVYCLLLRKGTKFISRYTQFDDAIGPQEKLCGWWTTSQTHSLHTPFSVIWFGFVMQCVQMQMVLWCNAQRREIYAACEQIYTPFSVVWFGLVMQCVQMHRCTSLVMQCADKRNLCGLWTKLHTHPHRTLQTVVSSNGASEHRRGSFFIQCCEIEVTEVYKEYSHILFLIKLSDASRPTILR